VIPVPAGFQFQPVDAGEVAGLACGTCAFGAPAGLVPDMAGPRVYGMADLVRGYLRARHKYRLVEPLRSPARPPAHCGRRESLPNEPSVTGPGRTCWLSG
jgi:hypothetical protein